MSLDQFGKIAAAEIAFYVPLLLVVLFVLLRHGFARRQGWIFLFTFSLVRIAGAAVTVAAKVTSNPPIGLFIAAVVLSGVGLAPLMLATQGFIMNIAQQGFPSFALPLRFTRILLIAGPIIAAVGGSMTSPGHTASAISTGRTLTRVSSVIYMAAFVVLFGLHIMLWRAKHMLESHHRRLLAGVSLALPPLFVRLVYSLLGSFASTIFSRWSPYFGDWWLYLSMGLIMEYLVATTYVMTGIMMPSQKQ